MYVFYTKCKIPLLINKDKILYLLIIIILKFYFEQKNLNINHFFQIIQIRIEDFIQFFLYVTTVSYFEIENYIPRKIYYVLYRKNYIKGKNFYVPHQKNKILEKIFK